ncbi:MAG: cyclic nucleotide-binding domain-containing protein [Candidatus Helarchaeota archaeon]|nr:cyclic nucleotide-binding domain-containing protein [Candidatus Helarchaeota archaeon]
MKVVNLKDKSLFDIARNITSLLGVGESKTTQDKNGVIIERINRESNLYHILILKKFVDMKTREFSFSLETEEGSLNPMKVNKSLKLINLNSVEVYLPSVMMGEEKRIKFKTLDISGKTKEIEIRKDTLFTHVPVISTRRPKKRLKRYKKDEVIFNEGDFGNEMYIIQKGKVGLFKSTKDGTLKLVDLDENSFFGEMTLLGDPHRSATARAIENSDLLVISKELFNYQINKIPSWFVTMFRTLIERLRKTNEMLDSLKRQISESGKKVPGKSKS